MHVETALRGVLISERWPKSGVDVVITVLEGEDDGPPLASSRGGGGGAEKGEEGLSGWGMMSVLSGCMTVASAAIADAGIDCSDLVSGGVAAMVVRQPNPPDAIMDTLTEVVLDPCPSEHMHILAVCVVGYLRSRDQTTEIWTRGDVDGLSGTGAGSGDSGDSGFETMMNGAVEAAISSRLVLEAALKEATEFKLQKRAFAVSPSREKIKEVDVERSSEIR